MEPEDEEITAGGVKVFCPATGENDCPANDMRCIGGSCRKLREQEAAKLAGDPSGAAITDWIERTRASAEERSKAAEAGKAVCPSCGDWLPLELHEFQCLGKGNHVAVRRDSIFPSKPPPLPKSPLDPEAEFRRALRNVAVSMIVVIVLLIVLGVLFKRASAPLDPSVPPAREGAS